MRQFFLKLLIFSFSITMFSASAFATSILSIDEATFLALEQTPELKQSQQSAEGLKQRSIAERQLPDPKVSVGAINVPTNNFSFSEDEMTMIAFGVSQEFPAGRSRHYQSAKTRALSKAERQRHFQLQKDVIRQTRNTWLELFYWTRALEITDKNRKLFEKLSRSIESEYSTGKATQQDLLQSQVEISRVRDQIWQIQQQMSEKRAELGRLIGIGNSNRPLPHVLPHWNVPSLAELENNLQQHPLLKSDSLTIQAAKHGVSYAKEQYKPRFEVGMNYGIRHGKELENDGELMKRSDMVGAQVTFNVPLFTHNRQQRIARASVSDLEIAQLKREADYRDLIRELETAYNAWQYYAKREQWFAKHTIPEARQNAKAALLGFQSATTDFQILMRSYSLYYQVQLDALRTEVDRLKAEATLHYLAGRPS